MNDLFRRGSSFNVSFEDIFVGNVGYGDKSYSKAGIKGRSKIIFKFLTGFVKFEI